MHFGTSTVLWGVIGCVVLIVVFAAAFSGGSEGLFDTEKAILGNLRQEVSVTGRVEAAKRVDLAFERTGKVNRVFVRVGDTVTLGELLVTLESDDIAAGLAQAEATVKIEQAKLDELTRGSRPEEINVEQVKVLNAEVALGEAKTDLINTITDAHTKADDSIRNKVDVLFTNPSTNPKIDLFVPNQQLKTIIEDGRITVEATLNAWNTLDIDAGSTEGLIYSATTVRNYLGTIKTFLENVALAVNSLTPSSALTQTTIDGYKTNVSTGRTTINTVASNVSAAEEDLKTAESALSLARQELVLTEAGTPREQLMAQEAKVEEAQAQVANYQAQLQKMTMRAPFSGIVTKQDAKVGEIVTSGKSIVTVISGSSFEVKADIPEADIANVRVGNRADITLDAYGDAVLFFGVVSRIEPAETIIEGVATYKTTLTFTKPDERIKSGMTANIDIIAGEKQNIVYIPSRAVVNKDGKSIVRIPTSATTYKEVIVETGIQSSDGNIEIIRGIEEGDEVIVFIREE